jgi:hypothetical protein
MKLFLRLKTEILRVLPIFIFFLIFFTLINSIETFLFKRAGMTPIRYIEVIIAAALIAKIVLVVDQIPLIHLFRKKPLAYGILWKTGIYWVLLFIVRLMIRFIPYLFGGNHFLADIHRFVSHFDINLFLSVQMFYLMLLFIFVTFQELTYKIGPQKMKELFFGR